MLAVDLAEALPVTLNVDRLNSQGNGLTPTRRASRAGFGKRSAVSLSTSNRIMEAGFQIAVSRAHSRRSPHLREKLLPLDSARFSSSVIACSTVVSLTMPLR